MMDGMDRNVANTNNRSTYIIKIKITSSSCAHRDRSFVEAHLCRQAVYEYSDRAYYGVYVFHRSATPFGTTALCSLYKGQQGDANQSVRGNYKKTRF